MTRLNVVVSVDYHDAARVQRLVNAGLLLGGRAERAELAAAPDVRPVPWHRAKALLESLDAEIREDGAFWPDQIQAYATQFLAAIEIDLRDERTLYETLGAVALMRACARNGRANGVIDEDVEKKVGSLCRALAVAMATLAPERARQ